VIGEHGDSEVLTWSLATVAGQPLDEFCQKRNIPLNDEIRQQIDTNVRRAAYQIISGKHATYYGIGSALARITDAILHDQRSILTVCAPVAEVAGVKNVTVALPHLVGGKGVLETFSPQLSDDEQEKLFQSASLIRRIIDELDQ
jgi:L-lactate dehydrogenase